MEATDIFSDVVVAVFFHHFLLLSSLHFARVSVAAGSKEEQDEHTKRPPAGSWCKYL